MAVISILAILAACQPKEKITEKIIEKPIATSQQEKLIKLDESMSDEELADSGEQLMLPHTIPLAEKAFKMALIKNPDNIKAQFYSEGFLKNYTVLKGILTRIKPFMVSQGKAKDLEKLISEIPNVPMRKYLLDGKEDIATVGDIQDFLFEQQSAWNNFRKWLIKNYDKSLVLNLDPFWLVVNSGVESRHACEVINEKEGKAICSYNNVFQKKLAPADLMALRQMIAGQVLLYQFYTSYSYDGLDKLAKFDPKETLTDEQRMNYLLAVSPNVLTLRKNHLLKETLHIGADLAEAVKYAAQYQAQLCPKGAGNVRQRPGFLLHDGICLENHQEPLQKLELALKGITTLKMLPNKKAALGLSGKEHEVDVRVDAFSWFRNPVQDLKSLGPAKYNECGKNEGLIDKTFGGFFVDGNGEDFIRQDSKCKPQFYNSEQEKQTSQHPVPEINVDRQGLDSKRQQIIDGLK